MTNMDGELSFLGETYDKFANLEAWPKPESENARDAWARQVVGLIKFYQRVETKDDYDEETYKGVFKKKSTPVDVARFPVHEESQE